MDICQILQNRSLLLPSDTGSSEDVQSGFGDYSAFFRAFKKMYQISPTECQADNGKLKKIEHEAKNDISK